MEFTKWHDWEVSGFLGRGSYGEVYRIERTAYGHTYESALKVIRIPSDKQAFDNLVNTGLTDEEAGEFFHEMSESIASEFALMSEFRGNSNIVSFEDFEVVNEDDGYSITMYIRMELLEPLIQYMKEQKMTKNDVIKLGCDILRALEMCESRNIIHRDIKPENVFRSKQGTFKLGDFGIARELSRTQTGMSRKGTVSYMAPEVYRGTSYGSNVDIYSLGIMLYRLMNNNRLPFLPPYPEKIRYKDTEEANLRRMQGDELPLPCNAQDELGSIILKACAFDPAERYQCAADMRKDLENYSSGGISLIPGDDTEEDEERTVSYPKPAAAPVVSDPPETAALQAKEKSVPGAIKEPVQSRENKPAEEYSDTAKENIKVNNTSYGVKKSGFSKIAVIAAIVIIGFIVFFAIHNSNGNREIEIAGSKYSANTMTVELFSEEDLTADDIKKLNKLPQLDTVIFNGCTLDNDLIAAIGSVKTGFTKLAFVDCHGFDDISPLADLEYLGFLCMDNCDITDSMLTGVDMGKMDHLVALGLQNNQEITSLDSINTLIPKLKGLSISKTGISDISGLSKAPELQVLLATDCNIKDISALRSKKMTYINLERNKISDIDVMKDMPELETVKMSDNDVSVLTPLTGLEKLETVVFNGNHISDLSPLAKCPALETLKVCGNGLDTLEGLSEHRSLTEIYVNDNNIRSLKGIEHELGLSVLAASRNNLTNLKGAENFTKLEHVNLEGNNIEDISVLKKSNNSMKWVNLNDNPVGSLTDLSEMTGLTGVYCDNTGIDSLDPIAGCKELTALSAQNNKITSIEAMGDKNGLGILDISDNNISDLSPMTNIYFKSSVFAVVMDVRGNKIKTLKVPGSDKYSMDYDIAFSGNPLSGAELTSSQGSNTYFLSLNYYEGMESEEWFQSLSSMAEIQVLGCPLDRQLAVQESLPGYHDKLFFPEKDESDKVMDPLLYEIKCKDVTVAVDTEYGKNAVPSEIEEDRELNNMESQASAE